MLKLIAQLKDSTLDAEDGEIGRVEEFYFDDETWVVRYLIVNTGNWLASRRVLIAPGLLRGFDLSARRLQVRLSREQVRNSPDIDTHKPVSRRHEARVMDYYGSAYYWGSSHMMGAGLYPPNLAEAAIPANAAPELSSDPADSHLRSSDELTGYRVQESGRDLGEVRDFETDPADWGIRFLQVGGGDAAEYLISPAWIQRVEWQNSLILVNRTQV